MTAARDMLRGAFSLGLVAVMGTVLLTGVDRLTAKRIAEQEKRVMLDRLGQIIPADYDNALLEDRITFRDEQHFPNGQAVMAYRARRGGKPLAVVLRFNATNGYNGDIGLLAGINADGQLRGVRVISHKETPGLGDAIEADKSDWILDFEGRSLDNPQLEQWAVRRDGGVFDQFTGATITPRAIVDAVRQALNYFGQNQEYLFSHAAKTGNEKT